MDRKQLVDFLVYLVVRILICIAQTVRIETGQCYRPTVWPGCFATC